jgi:hypothetical protein
LNLGFVLHSNILIEISWGIKMTFEEWKEANIKELPRKEGL